MSTVAAGAIEEGSLVMGEQGIRVEREDRILEGKEAAAILNRMAEEILSNVAAQS